ncbi:MAG: hypothetical protein AAFU56_07505, partial [Pseudomonadota bacterium]
ASRFVDPVVLGASAKPAAISPAGPRWFENDKSDDALAGGLVAFYAAQAHEVAREVNFAAGQVQAQRRKRISDKENGWYGLFTSKIANRLRSSPGITYQQLFQAVLADMNDTSVPGGARLQTPAREGTLFDATVLGGKKSVGVRQYPVSFDELNAGRSTVLSKARSSNCSMTLQRQRKPGSDLRRSKKPERCCRSSGP